MDKENFFMIKSSELIPIFHKPLKIPRFDDVNNAAVVKNWYDKKNENKTKHML